MNNQSKSKKIVLNVNEIKENIKKICKIDKSLIPQYLDNIAEKNNKNTKKMATQDNEFLKYM